MDGPIDVPGLHGVEPSADVIEVDSKSVAKRIVSDLIQSTCSRSAEAVTFQAKWVPRAIDNRVATRSALRTPQCSSISTRRVEDFRMKMDHPHPRGEPSENCSATVSLAPSDPISLVIPKQREVVRRRIFPGWLKIAFRRRKTFWCWHVAPRGSCSFRRLSALNCALASELECFDFSFVDEQTCQDRMPAIQLKPLFPGK